MIPEAGLSPARRRRALVVICLMVGLAVVWAAAEVLVSGRWVRAIFPIAYIGGSIAIALVQYRRD